MTYSDEVLKIATDLAYLDLHKAYEKLNSDINVVQAINYLIHNDVDLSEEDKEHYREIIKDIEKFEDSNKNKWKIADYKNDNEEGQTGFYGIVIDTGDGHIVSFRGSEDIHDPQSCPKLGEFRF
ncbi:hypothetical protein [Caldifermentibacillus hisashii]|uniref:hypothetical protein n=1 Tax=Caldifermentibacillus hisashii TaxID=996558 RepID=UPI0030E9CDBE